MTISSILFYLFTALIVLAIGIYLVFYYPLELDIHNSIICQGTAEECYYENPTCKRFAIDGKDCIRDGMTGNFFDTNIYYICKGYGKMTNSCQEYYSYEEFLEWLKEIETQLSKEQKR